MSTQKIPQDPEANPRVKAVFDDIRATRNSDFIGNVWKTLAFDPSLLENTWQGIKVTMATESIIPKKYKEMIYAAVSIANSCDYCIHSHTMQAKQAGMSDAEYAEFLEIVSLAAKTNHLLTALKVPLDPVMNMSAE